MCAGLNGLFEGYFLQLAGVLGAGHILDHGPRADARTGIFRRTTTGRGSRTRSCATVIFSRFGRSPPSTATRCWRRTTDSSRGPSRRSCPCTPSDPGPIRRSTFADASCFGAVRLPSASLRGMAGPSPGPRARRPGRISRTIGQLSGTVTWNGALLGVTPSDETVSGSTRLAIELLTLDGALDFTGLESWGIDAAPGETGRGSMWGDGDLAYSIEVRGNTFNQTGGRRRRGHRRIPGGRARGDGRGAGALRSRRGVRRDAVAGGARRSAAGRSPRGNCGSRRALPGAWRRRTARRWSCRGRRRQSSRRGAVRCSR